MSNLVSINEFDIIYISYDEPNADVHYADLCNKVPWAKRIHGVKGSDHAHKAAAEATVPLVPMPASVSPRCKA